MAKKNLSDSDINKYSQDWWYEAPAADQRELENHKVLLKRQCKTENGEDGKIQYKSVNDSRSAWQRTRDAFQSKPGQGLSKTPSAGGRKSRRRARRASRRSGSRKSTRKSTRKSHSRSRK